MYVNKYCEMPVRKNKARNNEIIRFKYEILISELCCRRNRSDEAQCKNKSGMNFTKKENKIYNNVMAIRCKYK